MIINKTKREMKITISTITLFVFTSALSAFTDNPTAPSDYFINFEGNYTDTDGDGMTDSAERKYNYNPFDANSRPKDIGYFIEQGNHVGLTDTKPTGSSDDILYFRFNNWPEDLENEYKDIIVHLMPIMFRLVGEPANNQVLDIYNRGKGRYSSWTVSSQGRTMMASEWYNPKMFIHELLHAWKGKYTFTNKKGSSDTSWVHTKATAGFEEGSADGLTIDIILEFINCYPNHEMSKYCITNVQSLRTGTTSTFDFLRGNEFMSCGNLWYDPGSIHWRYATVGDTFRIFKAHDELFMKKMLDIFYNKIDSDVAYRPSAENLVDIITDVLPEINGVNSELFISKLPWLSGKPIPNRLHIVCVENLQGWGGGAPWIYPAFADKYGKTYSYNATSKNFDTKGLPNWLKYHVDSRGYHWPDHMNQPFTVKVETIFGEEVITIKEKTSSKYDSKGKPKDLGKVSPKSLSRSNFPIGLYRQTTTFTEYAKFTPNASSENYFFGYGDFSQDKQNEFVVMLGVDCEVADKVVFRLGSYTQTSKIVNGCAILRTNKLPINSSFIAEFDVYDLNGSSNTYKRAIIKSAYTRDMFLQHSFVVVDRNFNGVEDIYEETITPIKNPKHTPYATIATQKHVITESFDSKFHNNVKVELQSDGILFSDTSAKTMYVYDQDDNVLKTLNKTSSGVLKRLLEFKNYSVDSLELIKVRLVTPSESGNINSPYRTFRMSDILNGSLNQEIDYDFVDENLDVIADNFNITSTLGGIKFNWSVSEDEIPLIVIHNNSMKIADLKNSSYILDLEKFNLNGTEELMVYFEVYDSSENLVYRTNEFNVLISDFKSAEEIEKEKQVKEFTRLVDVNNLPFFNVDILHNGIRLDFNTSSDEYSVINIVSRGRTDEFIKYTDFSLKGDEQIVLFVEFFEKYGKKLITTDQFELDLKDFFADYTQKKSKMEEKLSSYTDVNGNVNCKISSQTEDGVLFEWSDPDGLISDLVVFNNGSFVTSGKQGKLFLDFKHLNLVGTETIEIRQVVKTISGERVLYTNPTLIDLSEHRFISEPTWNDQFSSFVDINNMPKIVLSPSTKFDEGVRFDWNDSIDFRGVLCVTRGGREDGEYLVFGDHAKESAEFDFLFKNIDKNPNVEISLLVYDNFGFAQENFQWESDAIIVNLSSFTSNKSSDKTNQVIVDEEFNKSDSEQSNESEKDIIVDSPPSPPVVVNAWDNCKSIGNNWFHLEWFGHFFKQEGNGWVFHETLGWFYTEFTTDFSSIWLFHETHGWVWTTNEYFPYLFNPKAANWLYVVDGGFFSFNDNQWFLSE